MLQFDDEAARKLETVYSSADVVAQRSATLERLRLRPGEEVIDVGCGPDVTGVSEDEARQTLEDAGFRVEVISTGDGTTVEDQQPEFGVTAFRGAVITLFVG